MQRSSPAKPDTSFINSRVAGVAGGILGAATGLFVVAGAVGTLDPRWHARANVLRSVAWIMFLVAVLSIASLVQLQLRRERQHLGDALLRSPSVTSSDTERKTVVLPAQDPAYVFDYLFTPFTSFAEGDHMDIGKRTTVRGTSARENKAVKRS